MYMNRNLSRVLAAAVASGGFFVAPMPVHATQLSCSSFSATPDGTGNITVNCTDAGSPPPVSCSISVTPTTASATSSTTVTITTANCAAGAAVIGSKSTPTSASSNTWTDTIPPNTTTGSLTYTYSVSGGTNTATVFQPAPGGGGGTTGSISCPGYTNTLVYDLPWSALSKVTTKGFSNTAFVVGRFTTPATSVVSATATIFTGQFTEPTVVRTGAVSTSPCDLTGQGLGTSAVSPGVSQGPSWFYQINGTAPRLSGRLVLQPSTTYYINLTNRDKNNAPTCTAASCEMILQLTIPTGL